MANPNHLITRKSGKKMYGLKFIAKLQLQSHYQPTKTVPFLSCRLHALSINQCIACILLNVISRHICLSASEPCCAQRSDAKVSILTPVRDISHQSMLSM